MNLHSLFCYVDLLEVEVELLEEEVGVDVAKHGDLKKSRGGGSGRQSGGRVCSEQKYPHSVPKEAISIETEDKKFTNPPPFHPIQEIGSHIPDGCETSLDFFELFFDAHVISRIIRSTTSYAEHKKGEKRARTSIL